MPIGHLLGGDLDVCLQQGENNRPHVAYNQKWSCRTAV